MFRSTAIALRRILERKLRKMYVLKDIPPQHFSTETGNEIISFTHTYGIFGQRPDEKYELFQLVYLRNYTIQSCRLTVANAFGRSLKHWCRYTVGVFSISSSLFSGIAMLLYSADVKFNSFTAA